MTSAAFAGTNLAYQNKLSLFSGTLLSIYPIINWVLTTGSPTAVSAGENAIYWWVLSVVAGFSAVEFGKGVRDLGFGAGVATAVLAAWVVEMDDMTTLIGNVGFGGLVWAAMQFDKNSHAHDHGHAHGHARVPKEVKAPSAITKSLMKSTEGVPLIHSILIERDSRRIFYFMWYVFLPSSKKSIIDPFLMQPQLCFHARSNFLRLHHRQSRPHLRQRTHVLRLPCALRRALRSSHVQVAPVTTLPVWAQQNGHTRRLRKRNLPHADLGRDRLGSDRATAGTHRDEQARRASRRERPRACRKPGRHHGIRSRTYASRTLA